MPTVHIKGKVLPSIVKVTAKDLPAVRWMPEKGGSEMSITTRINASDVDVEFVLDRFEEADQSELLMRAWDLARAAVDIFCFTSGFGLTVYLDTFVNPDGSVSTILPQDATGREDRYVLQSL
jgi:hypothetical protein